MIGEFRFQLELNGNREFWLFEMVYSTAERIEMIYLYGECGRSFNATATRYKALHPGASVDHRYISRLIKKFNETGSVTDKKKTGRPPMDEETEIEVIGRASMNSQQSVREISQQSNVPKSTVHRILKKHKFHPYKIHLVQELSEDDFDRRIEFCELMTQRITEDPDILRRICFSDECTFFLHGLVNRHNMRYWCDENPHEFRTEHTQHPQKLNVWAGFLGDNIIGPFFIPGNLTGDLYLELLEDAVEPRITEIIEDSMTGRMFHEIAENSVIFQQDGCPAHYKTEVRQFLNRRYPNRWIGRRGPTEWPPRSPDMAPNDFFLWGHLKSIVYRTPPNTLEELKARIIEACDTIPFQTFEAVRNEFHQRLYYCQEVGGAQFEHLLN